MNATTSASTSVVYFMVAVCGRPSGLPGSSYPRSANPHTATTRSFRSEWR
ncbi:ash family protein [Pseudomonas sp. IPO3775]|nr:ash family protein [Pseudomonas sp. IPO3775]NWA76878.1 ash family protein [Pseudomonas sp. C8002]